MVLRKPKKEKVNPQRGKKCIITGCDGHCRTIGRVGDIELNYCGHHRKYGERVLNFFAASIFNQEIMDFLRESKQDLFWKNKVCFCDNCADKIKEYTNKMIGELDEAKKWKPRTKLSKNSKN